MTRPLFEQRLTVRLNAPDSVYHDHTGTVDAHDLEVARKRNRTITLQLDDDHSTIAYADELEVLGSTPPGGSADKGQTEAIDTAGAPASRPAHTNLVRTETDL